MSTAKALVLNPSAYGAASFAIALPLYQMNLIGYEAAAPETLLLCWTAFVMFVLAAIVWHRSYAALGESIGDSVSWQLRGRRWSPTLALLTLHVAGALGVWAYASGLAAYFGSWAKLGLLMMESPYEVRWAAEEVSSVGTQISYLGWLAIWITVARERRGQKSVGFRLLLILQLLLNLVYVDRTRPLWILFGVATIFTAMSYSKVSGAKLLRSAVILGASAVLSFVALGWWIGKINLSEAGHSQAELLATAFEPVYFYGTSGFAYLNRVILTEVPDWSLGRSLYPMAMVLSRLDLMQPPPPQVNEFLLVPMMTNVGTFLEPLYRDGGPPLALFGMAVHSFGFSWLGQVFLRRRNALVLIGWSTLCFCDFIAFFTPKFANTPTWLFVGLGVLVVLFGNFRESRRGGAAKPSSDSLENGDVIGR
jgi:oligosaccharide repeat unit polymerase